MILLTCFDLLTDIQEKLGIMNSGEVYSVFSYEAQHNDELTFMINDPLTILRKGDDAEREWWWARNTINQEGYVPRNLLGVSYQMSSLMTEFNKMSYLFSYSHGYTDNTCWATVIKEVKQCGTMDQWLKRHEDEE